MNKKLKRAAALAMSAVITLMSAAITPVVHAAGTVTVSMANLGVPLFNIASSTDSTAKENYLYLNNGLLNPGYKFTKTWSYNTSCMKSNLAQAYTSYHQRTSNGKWWNCSYIWEYHNDSGAAAFRSLVAKGDVQFELSAALRWDKHTSAKYHWLSKSDYAMIQMYENAKLTKEYVNTSNDSEGTYVATGNGIWTKVTNGGGNLQVVMDHTACTCGSSEVYHAAVGLADLVSPKISSVGTTTSQTYYNSGTVDITVTFDENIRFADGGTTNKTASAANQLVLAAYDRQSGQSVDNVTADLVSLKNNTLTYRYTVPNNTTTDIVITGIADTDNQPMLKKDNALYMYTKDGKYQQLTDSNGDMTIKSPFCDLAGNSVATEWKSKDFARSIYIDTVPPAYSATNITGSMMIGKVVTDDQDDWPADIDRSQVFAGVGDTLVISSDFNEEVKISNVKNIKATLNIKDAKGNNVVLSGKSYSSVSNSVNSNIKVTRVVFDTLTITEGMTPDDDARAITIKSIDVTGVTDLCSNAFASGHLSDLPAAKQQEWLDTVSPTVTTLSQPDSITSLYSVYTEGDGFCFPVQIKEQCYEGDVVTNAALYQSGVEAVGDGEQAQESGYFMLTDAATVNSSAQFEYYVSTNKDLTGNETWKTGTVGNQIPFVQIGAGNYIHIRPIDGSDKPVIEPVLTVSGYDYAGNKSNNKPYQLNIKLEEHVKPMADASIGTDTVSNVNRITANVMASDAGGLAEVKYKLVINSTDENTDSSPPAEDMAVSADWTDFTDFTNGDTTVNVKVAKESTTGRNNFAYLYVYSKDRCGNENTQRFTYNIDLRMPSYSVNVPVGVSSDPVSISKLNVNDAKTLGWTWGVDVNNANGNSSNASVSDIYKTYGTLMVAVKAGSSIIARFVDDLTDENPKNLLSGNTSAVNKPVSKASFENGIINLLNEMDPADEFAVKDSNGIYAFAGGMVYDGYGIDFNSDMIKIDDSYAAQFSMREDQIEQRTASAQTISDELKNYYGEVDIYTLLMNSIEYQTPSDSNVWYIFRSISDTAVSSFRNSESTYGAGTVNKPPTLQKYTLKSARDDGDSSNPINTAEFGNPRMANGEAISENDVRLNPDSQFLLSSITGISILNPVTKFSTLAGIQIPFTVKNNRVESWGIEDIDFEKSSFTIYRDSEEDEVYTQSLASGTANQVVVFPDMEYETGNYYVKVTLTAKASGREDTYKYGKCFCVLNIEPDKDSAIRKAEMVQNSSSLHLITLEDNTESGIPVDSTTLYVYDAEKHYSANNRLYYYSNDIGVSGLEDKMVVNVWFSGHEENKKCIVSTDGGYYVELLTGSYWPWTFYENYRVQVPYESGEDSVTLCYQAVYVNGKATPVRQIEINFSTEKPEIECKVVPEQELTESVQIEVDGLYSANGDIYKILVIPDFHSGEFDYTYDVVSIGQNNMSISSDGASYSCYSAKLNEDNTLSIDFGDGYKNSFTSEDGILDHRYTIVAFDSIGAVTSCTELDLSTYVDEDPPNVTISDTVSEGSSYSFKLNLSDHELSNGDNMRVYFSPNKPSETDEATFLTESNNDAVISTWIGLFNSLFGAGGVANAAGIYNVTPVTYEANNYTVQIEGSVPSTGELYVWAEDELGHISDPINVLEGQSADPSAQPSISGIARAEDGSLKLTFTEGVLVTDPLSAGNVKDSTYSKEKSGIPIYNDGKYTIKYEDIFGNEYSEEIEVALDGDFALNTEITPTTATNGNVTIHMTSERDDDLLKITGVSFTDLYVDWALTEGEDFTYTLAEDGQSLDIEMINNGTVTVTLKYGGEYGSETQTRVFKITNIDRYTSAAIRWEYQTGTPRYDATETAGTVTAICYSTSEDEELTGVNGSLRYTFSQGKAGDTHTFEFVDDAGNTGSITATLPIDINIPEPPRLDSYTIQVSGLINSRTCSLDDYTYYESDAGSDEGGSGYDFTELSPAQRDTIKVDTNIDSKIFILPAGTTADNVNNDTQNAEIDGISLSGRAITVTENAEFTIALLESEDFVSEAEPAQRVIIIPVNIINIQKLSKVDLIYSVLSRFVRRVYFDPKGQNLTLTNSTGIAQETEHEQYRGYWYHDFDKNGQFIFYYKDIAGNTGSITATVNDIIDMVARPSAGGIRWWPYKYNEDNPDDESTLTEDAVNFNVTAQIRFNMNITEAALYYPDEMGNANTYNPVSSDKAALNVTMDLVDITYKENTDPTVLVVKGENDTTYSQQINAISVIDKTPPIVEPDYTADTDHPRKNVTVTFTPSEDVLSSAKASADYYNENNPLSITLTENGTYEYVFTDRAGNTTNVSFDVTDIDHTPPTLSYKLSETGTEYSDWGVLVGENDVSEITTVFIKTDEAVEYTFQNLEGNMDANTWTELSIERNGLYPLHITDKAGNLTLAGLSGILVPDDTAPVLWLSPLRISVPQGTNDDELERLLKQGALISDNVSSAENISLTWDLSKLDVNIPGEYSVIYTAEDEAGNIAKSERFVRVVGNEEITLAINGKDTAYMGTLLLDTGDVTFEVGNLTNTNGVYEPYMLYVKKGFKTIGQMKNNSTKIADNTAALTDTGFYTVYVMTQTRKQYITYLYIEQ